MENALLETIQRSTLPDNAVRAAAEAQFHAAVASQPSECAEALVALASNSQISETERQAALVYLKRVILSYWSLGYESFVGPPVETALKARVRSGLIELLGARESKLRRAASGLVVAIGVVDYPDEWPDLMLALFALLDGSESQILGGLLALTDLFDEVVAESHFFEGGLGEHTLGYCLRFLSPDGPVHLQAAVLGLLEVALKQIQGPEVFTTARAEPALRALERVLSTVVAFVREQCRHLEAVSSTGVGLLNVQYVAAGIKAYEVLVFMATTHNRRLFLPELKRELQSLAVSHWALLGPYYENEALVAEPADRPRVSNKGHESEYPDTGALLDLLVVQVVQFIGSLLEEPLVNNSAALEQCTECIFLYNALPQQIYELYVDNFNEFVTEETEMLGQFTVRHLVGDFLLELQDADATAFTAALLERLRSPWADADWRRKEAVLCGLQALFLNEDAADSVPGGAQPEEVLALLVRLMGPDSNPAVRVRAMLVSAKFAEKYGASTKTLYSTLMLCLQVAATVSNSEIVAAQGVQEDPLFDKSGNDATRLIQAAALIAFTYYGSFLEFDDEDSNAGIHQVVRELVGYVSDESEEDTPVALLEALELAIRIDLKNAQRDTKDIVLVFALAGVDPSNIASVQTAKDAMESLLNGISEQEYIQQCETGLPSLVAIVEDANRTGARDFSLPLNMALELLGAFVAQRPAQGALPEAVFGFIFAPLVDLLSESTDDQILQAGGEVLDLLILHLDKQCVLRYQRNGVAGLDMVLRVLSRFLLPELSDSAAMNVGLIVLSIVKIFGNDLGLHLPKILESAAHRLVAARLHVIIENLVSVFLYLVLVLPNETLDFLGGMEISTANGPKNGLQAVLPVWLESFSTTRGFDGIQQNVKALGQIFLLKDSRVESIVVQGDVIEDSVPSGVIVTRSMAKKRPVSYTQIPALLKILKLLVQELGFQLQQDEPEPVTSKQDDGDDGWEDVDDAELTEFKRLRSYVEDGPQILDELSEKLKTVIRNFLVECIRSAPDYFERHFNELTESEKQIISKTV